MMDLWKGNVVSCAAGTMNLDMAARCLRVDLSLVGGPDLIVAQVGSPIPRVALGISIAKLVGGLPAFPVETAALP